MTDGRKAIGGIWSDRAARLLEDALDQLSRGHDPLPEISAAETALRIEAGERSPDEMEGYPFPGEDEGCTCPPALRARGGFTSTCPAHGSGIGGDRG
ncbi:hypothetical protein AB0J43_02790 [Nonomuraea fuscirosea]